MFFVFMVLALFFFHWVEVSVFRFSAVKVEDYSCLKCGLKVRGFLGRRTCRCGLCGATFIEVIEVEDIAD